MGMAEDRRGCLLLMLMLLLHGGCCEGLRRQTRQLPRFPFFDNLLARIQGRPPPPPPRIRPPQFEGGFTPLSSAGGPSIADSVDLTFQSLEQQQRRPAGPALPPQGRPTQLDVFGRPLLPFPAAPVAQTPSPPADTRRATLREVLQEDCEHFEDRGYCESPHRYPTAQVVDLMSRCSRIVESLYVPLPVDSNSITQPPRGHFERANHETWSWAQYSKENTICTSEAHTVTPSYARDASGKWVVVLQHGNMVQRVPVDRCVNVGAPCHSEHQAARCEQRRTHHHLVTWDPDAPNDCPALRVVAFPTACLCKFADSKIGQS